MFHNPSVHPFGSLRAGSEPVDPSVRPEPVEGPILSVPKGPVLSPSAQFTLSEANGLRTGLSKGRAGRPLFWSPITIPGRPRVLLLDATSNTQGWEREFAARLHQVLRRKGIGLASEAPVEVKRPEEMAPTLSGRDDFNCILLFGHGPHSFDVAQDRPNLRFHRESDPQGAIGPLPKGEGDDGKVGVGRFWRFLVEQPGLSPKLLALCTCEDPDLQTSQEVLEAKSSFAKLAVAPLSPLSQRVAGLFFMKFFTELDLHSEAEGTVTGKMVWFSHAKAKVLLDRRHYPGDVGVRC